ncbi:zinc finger protein with KRAB and SCAN domains 1 [Esox lucius]|uniref:C2H2-type domain-containing protein n=1 Tax=Esox lucius TaxID=8010 RepID=A0A3P8XEP4_ESOLU|nr:zinc finger protein with KRAB and SCAN domains 1 [Esox lucius]
MSVSEEINFQTQIASVLDSLAKVAVVEITKLFESRLLASGATILIERQTELNETLLSVETVKKHANKGVRSIGIQVDETTTSSELPDLRRYSSLGGGSDSLYMSKEKCSEARYVPLLETKTSADIKFPFLEEDVEEDSLGPDSPTNTEPEGKQVICTASVDSSHLSSSVQSSTTELKHQPLKTEPHDGLDTESLTKVCLIVSKAEEQDSTPQPECIETLVQVEPQQASVSTAKGKAYSPSSSDGALAPIQAGSKVQSIDVRNPSSMIMKKKKVAFKLGKKKKRKVALKVDQTRKEQKLTRPCSVQLVNLLLDPRGKRPSTGYCNNSKKCPMPKDLKTHQGLHTGRRLCCFTQCGNGVWRLQGVLSPSRAHACKICGKRFKRRKILRRHERFHTGEKPYSCSQCSKMFALRKSLRRHERFHTGDKPHRCTQCGKSFRLRDNLKAHLRFHTGERPFTCSLCSKSFRILRNLEQHSVVVHSDATVK